MAGQSALSFWPKPVKRQYQWLLLLLLMGGASEHLHHAGEMIPPTNFGLAVVSLNLPGASSNCQEICVPLLSLQCG